MATVIDLKLQENEPAYLEVLDEVLEGASTLDAVGELWECAVSITEKVDDTLYSFAILIIPRNSKVLSLCGEMLLSTRHFTKLTANPSRTDDQMIDLVNNEVTRWESREGEGGDDSGDRTYNVGHVKVCLAKVITLGLISKHTRKLRFTMV